MNERISRIMLVSPDSAETIRRNHSRIFIWPKGESAIDAMIFQSQRPIEQFKELAGRAILMAGLSIDGQSEMELDVVDSRSTTSMQQHFVTRGWCVDDDSKIYDIIIEASLSRTDLGEIEISTLDPVMDDINTGENPLIISVDVDDLVSLEDEEADEASNVVEMKPKQETTNESQPKQPPKQVAARRSQDDDNDGDENTEGRMKGKPGRVRHPWDGRLKQNRTK